jgi:hypothetical protein
VTALRGRSRVANSGQRSRLVAVDQGGSSASRPLWVCRHEAAHAVVAHELGEHVFGVHLSARGGQTLCQLPRRPDPLRLGMVSMAGHAADVLWNGFREDTFPTDDLADLRAQGFRGPSMPTLFALAAGQCQAHEPKIRAVAAALKKGDLDRRSFLRALRAAAPAARGPSALDLAASRANARKRGAR